jgi:DNA-binding NarL/FixJ family response regulator
VRQQLLRALNEHADWKVVAECANADEALREIPASSPDLLLLDIILPTGSGIDLIQPLKAALPRLSIVMLTVVEDPRQIACAIGLGASGYLLKQDAPNLLSGVEDILAGRAPLMSPSVARQIWAVLEELKLGVAQRNCGLTEREREVIDLASHGNERGEIALALKISTDTVKHHFSNIFRKLEVHSLKEALIKLRNGRGFLD